MSYGRDKDILMRGVGAVAAFDAGNNRRARARAIRKRAMAVIDARRARLAFGPGRALPVPMGRISSEGEAGGGSTRPSGRPQTPPTPVPEPSRPVPRGPSTSSLTIGIRPVIGPGRIIPTRPPVLPPSKPVPQPTRPTFPTFPTTPTVAPIIQTTPTDGGGGGGGGSKPWGGGGGGGSGVVTPSPQPVIDLTPVPDMPPPSSDGGMSTNTKIAIGVGVLGALYLLSRR